MLTITSLDNPRARRVAALRKSRDRRETGLLVAEGLREVERALAAGLALRELWWSPAMLGEAAAHWERVVHDAQARWPNAILLQADPRVMQKLAYREKPEGALAIFEAPQWSLERALAEHPDSLWLIAVGTEKPGNLGAMVRSAAAAGAAGVLVADEVADVFNPNAIRASTAAVFSMPVISVGGVELRQALRRQGVRLAMAVAEGGVDYTRADLCGPLAIVIGPEDRGLDDAWLRPNDPAPDISESPDTPPLPPLNLTIPMAAGPVDSLNASVAAAVLLFESARQRRATD